MLPQYSDLEWAALCKKAGKDSDEYKKKMSWLQQKVPKRGGLADETLEMRLMGTLIYDSIGPLHIALITDNLAVFKQQYALYPSNVNPSKLFDQACFCGSQAVAEFLMDQLKLTYLTCGYERVKYVADSPNLQWAGELAQHMASAGKEVPDHFFTTGSAKDVLIDPIFTPYKLIVKPNPLDAK